MNPKQTQEGYDGIYLERSGKSALGLTEILIAQPEFPLDEAQKEEAYEFDWLILKLESDRFEMIDYNHV